MTKYLTGKKSKGDVEAKTPEASNPISIEFYYTSIKHFPKQFLSSIIVISIA